jgi:hypothetical protein
MRTPLLLVALLFQQVLFAQFDCTTVSTSNTCNLFSNPGFSSRSGNYDPYVPFLADVTSWTFSHGSPQLNLFGSLPNRTNYACMWSFTNRRGLQGEGIAQILTGIIAGHTYVLSFEKKMRPDPAQVVDELSVVLTKCWQEQQGNDFIPTFSGQVVYDETNIINKDWERVSTCFTAEDDYDMAIFYPRNGGTQSWICILQPELIDITGFNAGPINSPDASCQVLIGPPGPLCAPNDATFTWHGPSGQIIQVTAANPQITIDASIDFGTWTIVMNRSGITLTNNSADQGCANSYSVEIPRCFIPCSAAITPSGPIDVYEIYDGVLPFTLTSASATGNQWYRNGVAIPGATNQTYTFNNSGNIAYTNQYTVVVNGCLSNAVNYNWHPVMTWAQSEYPAGTIPGELCASNTSMVTNITQPTLGPGTVFTWVLYQLNLGGCATLTNYSSSSGTVSVNFQNCTNLPSGPNGVILGYEATATLNGQQRILYCHLTSNPNCRTANTVSISPNPVISTASITSAEPILLLEVLDVANSVRFRTRVNRSTKYDLNVQNMQPGLYQCRITTASGIVSKKLVVFR